MTRKSAANRRSTETRKREIEIEYLSRYRSGREAKKKVLKIGYITETK